MELEPLKSNLLDPRSRATAEAAVSSAEAAVNMARSELDRAQTVLRHSAAKKPESKARS